MAPGGEGCPSEGRLELGRSLNACLEVGGQWWRRRRWSVAKIRQTEARFNWCESRWWSVSRQGAHAIHLAVERPMELRRTDGVTRWNSTTAQQSVNGPPQLTKITTLGVDFTSPELFTLLATKRQIGKTLRGPRGVGSCSSGGICRICPASSAL